MSKRQSQLQPNTDIPLLTLRNQVLFPGSMLRIKVGRPRSVRLLSNLIRAQAQGKELMFGVVAQKTANTDDPTSLSDLYQVGCTANIVEVSTPVRPEGDGAVDKQNTAEAKYFTLVIEGVQKFQIQQIKSSTPFLRAQVSPSTQSSAQVEEDTELHTLKKMLKEAATEALKLLRLPKSKGMNSTLQDADKTMDIICAHLDASVAEKQAVLVEQSLKARIKLALQLLHREIEVLKISQQIDSEVKGDLSKQQREFYLRKQLKAIKDQLGEGSASDSEDSMEALERRLKEAELSPAAQKLADQELKRLTGMQPSNAQYSVSVSYLETLADLPWNKSSDDVINLAKVREQLDQDHHGLSQIKKRIVEFLAVRKLNNKGKVPILCFMGPPGVGKTSLGSSIAKAMGREFVRASLGGVRDDAEIRGHRRTYVGAMSGRIMQGLLKCGVNNPVFLLDEIDKLTSDFRGDPSAALLEVLDPEQNSTFSDHYVEAPFDLSKVLFIATGNEMKGISGPLRDRMEVIELSGYTIDEKMVICNEHVLPSQCQEHGLMPEELEMEGPAFEKMITGYTREAGVRELQRKVGAVCRHVAVQVAEQMEHGEDARPIKPCTVGPEDLHAILGPELYQNDLLDQLGRPGVALGLAWTPVGGEALVIEVSIMAGTGQVRLTGQLGDVMKESASMSLSWIRANSSQLGLAKLSTGDFLQKHDIHVHFPAGGVPKDGPSAGVAITMALLSMFWGRSLRSDCLLYTSDAADEEDSVDLGGRRIIKKKKKRKRIGYISGRKNTTIRYIHQTKKERVKIYK
eukprot:TRINITY_DN1668_c0_g1_i3.p1 TRINITY_DN1668_c0_g1~~TRINITY_DN1668_c0_g1_i3.p1  ORF type:complete len:798 (-),score=207.01 TRINITY_DN1668_c0_g1_i3:1-2394(-)